MRNMQKALLLALLEPIDAMRELENSGDFAGRLARLEENRFLPAGIVWEEFCRRNNAAADDGYMNSIREYEKKVLAGR
jgi:L-rhamnose isomerase